MLAVRNSGNIGIPTAYKGSAQVRIGTVSEPAPYHPNPIRDDKSSVVKKVQARRRRRNAAGATRSPEESAVETVQ